VYLRAWQDFDHHTLILTEAPEPGLAHIGWRVATREDALDLERKVEDAGLATRWIEGSEITGHGDALRFFTPGGLPFEVYWEVSPVDPPEEMRSLMPSHPSRRTHYGAAPRRVDHVTFAVDDVVLEQRFLTDVCGIRHNYYSQTGDERWGSWMSCNNLSHEIALIRGATNGHGMLHHVAYYADSVEDVLRCADLLVDHGYGLEWGPGKHGTSGATFLYFREPSGNRVEVWTGGLLIFAPDWKAIEWGGDVQPLGNSYWSTPMPDSFVEGTSLPRDLAVAP
jgi:catechol 2,3-dioxygenase